MKTKILIAFAILSISANCLASDSWPGSAPTTIATLPEASGIVWHSQRGTLFAVQNTGTLVEINTSGETVNSWTVGGDLEAITLAEGTRYLYLGVENPDSIVEFDLQTEMLTGKSWNLTTWMTGAENSGLEGLAYSSGYFYAGLQADGQVYVFNVNLSESGNVSFIEAFRPDDDYTSDVSGIDINSLTERKYIVYDMYNALVELNSSNVEVADYSLPGDNQEGIAIVPNCLSGKADVYIADDSGYISKYTDYPITCTDTDPPAAPSGLSVQ